MKLEDLKATIEKSRYPYSYQGANLVKAGKDGDDIVTNFSAIITEEVLYHDGTATQKSVRIEGAILADEGEPSEDGWIKLPDAIIPAEKLESDSWLAAQWGTRPIVFGAIKDFVIALKLFSRPARRHVYKHIGWGEVDGKSVYLHAHGAIDAHGPRSDVEVELPFEIQRYEFQSQKATKEDVLASLRLINIARPEVTWPLLLATYRAAIGEADFAIHLAGRTGTRKSEICSLFQSHYGETMDARKLPGSWSSTENALEALAYRAKNAIFTIDDYVPQGTSYQVKQLASKADRLFRGQGNQSGRQRMTDTSSMQGTMFPRGIILSTGEDVPEGHSVRGRMMILELEKDDVDLEKLTTAQNARPSFSRALADWIQWLAENPEITAAFKARRDEMRREYLGIGHSRTPTLIADLALTAELMSEWIAQRKYLSPEVAAKVAANGEESARFAGNQQSQYLETADPVLAFVATIALMLSNGSAHLKTKGGGVPQNPRRFGWAELDREGSMPEYKSNGARIGWVDLMKGEVLIEPGIIPSVAKASGGKIGITEATLLKRLKEGGMLSRIDSVRQRNTIRVTLEGSTRQVIAMPIGVIFPDDDEPEEAEATNQESE